MSNILLNQENPFEVLFKDFFKSDGFSTLDTRMGKPVDIYIDEEGDLTIEVAAVGVSKDDITIKTAGDIIRISYNRTDETKKQYFYSGISKSSFDFGYRINGSNFDLAKVDATLEKGILKIVIPAKAPQEDQIKTISIR